MASLDMWLRKLTHRRWRWGRKRSTLGLSESNGPTCVHCGTTIAQKRKDIRCAMCGKPRALKEGEYLDSYLQLPVKETKNLKRIGYWLPTIDPTVHNYHGYSHYEHLFKDGYPDIRRAVRPGWGEDIRDRLRAYLRNGQSISAFLGHSSCRFNCRLNFEVLGNRELSDGEWVWPEGLVHYVERHDVQLPDEFLQSIEARHFEFTPFSRDDYSIEISDSLWLDWAKQLPSLESVRSISGKTPTKVCLYVDPGRIEAAGDWALDDQFNEFIEDVWTQVLKQYPEREVSLGAEWMVSDVPLTRIEELKGPLLEGLRYFGLSDMVTLFYTRPDPEDWHKDQDVILQLNQG